MDEKLVSGLTEPDRIVIKEMPRYETTTLEVLSALVKCKMAACSADARQRKVIRSIKRLEAMGYVKTARIHKNQMENFFTPQTISLSNRGRDLQNGIL